MSLKESPKQILECYNVFSGVELSMRSFFVIYLTRFRVEMGLSIMLFTLIFNHLVFHVSQRKSKTDFE